MKKEGQNEVTRLLQAVSAGDSGSMKGLLPLVYDDLRSMADRAFGNQRKNHTLQPTALVSEAYLRIAGAESEASWENRRHFLAVAGMAMRQVLADHARAHLAEKRGGSHKRVMLELAMDDASQRDVDLVDFAELLETLSSESERQARVVELRYLAGMTVEETARVLGISQRSVLLDWKGAREWLETHLDANEKNRSSE